MDNPYQSPISDSDVRPVVDVVLRPRWAWRKHDQVYRFTCWLDENLVEKVAHYFQRQRTRLLQYTGTELLFEREGTSIFRQFGGSEKRMPHTIHVSVGQIPSSRVVICHYQIRLLIPDMFVPPYPLEQEVVELAMECGAELGKTEPLNR